MVRLILQLFATKTSVKRVRHKAAHARCCSRPSRPSVTLPFLLFWRSGAVCLHRGYGFVRRLPVPILQDKLSLTCLRTEPKRVSTNKPIPSLETCGHDNVQRKARRQRVKRHMREQAVTEPYVS